MILVDCNLLIYAHFSSYAEHVKSRDWLDEQFANGTRIGLPWASLLAFLRITTSRRSFPNPQSIQGAWSQVRAWLDQPTAFVPEAERATFEGIRRADGRVATRNYLGIISTVNCSATASIAMGGGPRPSSGPLRSFPQTSHSKPSSCGCSQTGQTVTG